MVDSHVDNHVDNSHGKTGGEPAAALPFCPTDDMLDELNELILRLGRAFAARKESTVGVAHSCGHVSEAHLMMLRRLSIDGAMRMNEIGALLNIKPPAVSGLVDHLEQVKVVMREADPDDRRATRVAVTDFGRESIKQLEEYRRRAMRSDCSALTESDVDDLTRIIRKLLAHVSDVKN